MGFAPYLALPVVLLHIEMLPYDHMQINQVG